MIKSRKKRRQAQTYWGVLIVNDNTCPVCGNRLINKFQEYWIYGTYEKPATTTYLKSLHCTMCNLSFVGESEMAANNLNYVRGFRGKRIQGKIGLAEARRFAYTPYLKYKKCSFKHGVTVKSRKTQYDTDSLFEFIFNNSKDFDLTFFAANDLRNLLKRYVGNMEYRNCREETDVLNAWENILTRYLPFGQTYAINPEQLGVLIGLLYTDDMFSRLAKGGDFFDKLKKYIFSIIEGCYFSLNQSVKEAYGILRKARKSNKTDKIEQIKKWYKEQYIKAMIYENPPLYVNVYSGKLSCVVHNHKIEERTGYV
ncbi:MAG: hypothetical protein J6B56_02965, partial [Clostridia bacterium]|nr:hypothetical protein [Clostridia bacterium]